MRKIYQNEGIFMRLATLLIVAFAVAPWSSLAAFGYARDVQQNKARLPPKQEQTNFQVWQSVEDATKNVTQNTLLFKPLPRTAATLPRASSNSNNFNSSSIPTLNTSVREKHKQRSSSSGGGRWIGADQLNHLKETVNIMDVVDAYNLDQFERKSRERATAVCPFHDDHNPSLGIDKTRGIYKCFACGEGGDVFHFVRQMARLKGEDLTFYDSVRRVQEEFGDGSYLQTLPSLSSNRAPTLTKEELEKRKRLQERIFQMNAAAAAFYANALTLPSAGAARARLAKRYITPDTVRTFALGFSPDAYFGPTVTTWGAGSLVDHLRHLGFTPNELVAAGLVTQTKRATEIQVKTNLDRDSEDGSSGTMDLSYDVLMDRFRGRIVVPIFDSTGKRILGFGGRILEESSSEEFQQPKYLNSPESLVFQKKNVLFGLHFSMETREKSTDITIVEGYMDAIALQSVGVNGVVASMGTALSQEQLLAAAQTAYHCEGCLILCLDSDEAGFSAVERLCVNGMISDVLEKRFIDIRVASLPDGKKDPGEYVESRLKRGSKKETIASDIRDNVLKKSIPWTEWYIERTLNSYSKKSDPGEKGSLRAIIDRLAQFINICGKNLDRENKASDIAASLADLIAQSTNSTIVSDTVRNQLESDLLQLAANKGLAKEAAKRGGADYDDMYSPIGSMKNRLTASLARGHGPTSGEQQEQMLLEKLSRNLRNEQEVPTTPRPTRVLRQHDKDYTQVSKAKQSRSSLKVKRRQSSQPDLIPHFSGFTHFSDADGAWLEAGKRGANLVLGQAKENGRSTQGDDVYPLSKKLVYFNSNEYMGQQFISDEAIKAGYSSEGIVRDPSIARKGLGVLLKPNTDKILSSTEDQLLVLLARSGVARLAVKNWLDSRRAVNSEVGVHWTNPAREWLFTCLVDEMTGLPAQVANPSELRECLCNREDTPIGAFTTTRNMTDCVGNLDLFFLDPLEIDEASAVPKNGDVQAQELLATLVWASTAHSAQLIKAELAKLISSLEALPPVQNATVPSDESATPTNTTLVRRSDLEPKCAALAQNMLEVVRSQHSLADSASRIRNRMLRDNSAFSGVRRMSKTQQKEFEETMDEFVLNYSPREAPPEMDIFLGTDDATTSEPYEDTLETIDSDWKVWLSDDESEVEPSILPPILSDDMDDENGESMEEFDARLFEDWGELID